MWSASTSVIEQIIADKINEYTEFDDFVEKNHFEDEDKAITFLNKCYQYIGGKCNTPNQVGEMINKEIYISDNCPKNIVDFILLIDPDNHIREKLTNTRIKNPSLPNYDILLLISEMNNKFQEVLNDPEKSKYPKIIAAIQEIHFPSGKFDESFFMPNQMNDVDKEKLKLFCSAYVNNVYNRLRELCAPSESLQRCWPFELIQNAKDTIANENRKVNIEFVITENELTFIHDGADFELKSMLGLLYKISEGKEGVEGSTGRFGTGFLTTHIISKIVYVTGDVVFSNGTKKGFKVKLNRSGTDKNDLRIGFNEMENSKEFYNELFHKTTFTYPIDNDESLQYLHHGIKNLRANIPQVLIFCPNINKITINDKGDITEYTIGDTNDNIITINIKAKNTIKTRKFLFYRSRSFSQELSSYYKRDRQLEVSCCIEINENNSLIPIKNECLFCTFPLVGSSAFRSPMYVNSPDFETTTERDGFFLKNPEKNDEISIINTQIFTKSVDLFQKIVQYCSSNNVQSLFHLADGLKTIPLENNNFSRDAYATCFIHPLRQIIQKSKIFLIDESLSELESINIPNYCVPKYILDNNNRLEDDIELYPSRFYEIFKQIFPNTLEFNVSIEWSKRLWLNFPNSYDFIRLLEKIASYRSICHFPMTLESDIFVFINKYVEFVSKYDQIQFTKFTLLPNQNGQLTIADENLYLAPNVENEVVDLIHKLGDDWRSTHVDTRVTAKSINSEHSLDVAMRKVQTLSQESDNNAIVLMSYIIDNDQNRLKMFEITKEVFPSEMPSEPIILSNFSLDVWSEADRIVRTKILSSFQSNSVSISIKNMSDIISHFLQNGLSLSTLKQYKVFPNQHGQFKNYSQLYEDGIKYTDLKEALYRYCNQDARSILIHDDFKCVRPTNIIYMCHYDTVIDKLYTNIVQRQNSYILYQVTEELKPVEYSSNANELAKLLLKYIDSNLGNQEKLLESFNAIMNANIQKVTHENVMRQRTFQYISHCIVAQINAKLSQYKTIEKLKLCMKQEFTDDEHFFEFLNVVYSFAMKDSILLPNQKGDFRPATEMKVQGNDIEDELINIQNKLDPSHDIQYILCHKKVGRFPTLIEKTCSLVDICKMIDDFIMKNYTSWTRNPSKEVQKLIDLLLKYIEKKRILYNFPHIESIKDTLEARIIFDKFKREKLDKLEKLSSANQAFVDSIINECLDQNISDKRKEDALYFLKNGHLPHIYSFGGGYGFMYRYSGSYRSGGGNRYYGRTGSGLMHEYERSSSNGGGTRYFGNGGVYFEGSRSQRGYYYYDGPTFGDFYSYMDHNHITGYTGEAYIYELLRNLGYFTEVRWNSMAQTGTEIKYNHHTYHIQETGLPYDLYAKDYNGKEYYIEVKTTSYSEFGRLPFLISERQIKFMTEHSSSYYLFAFVANIYGNPHAFFLQYMPDFRLKQMIDFVPNS
ncbi:hypothetical protein TRFO_04887 [Tritrichomonas foetus]|uniref:Protein NO VEIN C-terminal domain-containing protein n=1 Tax=Tritrichomonas foetus TaxID=1144522 RepID=A0A1J4KEU5_9EUKA|nr:hypothetical protein TRFO_04887 [Tritrichomonas foetus]|eukprot:OHT08284.1 hypothetical protein TRFO_04887 [Tritrichomonas foetus]